MKDQTIQNQPTILPFARESQHHQDVKSFQMYKQLKNSMERDFNEQQKVIEIISTLKEVKVKRVFKAIFSILLEKWQGKVKQFIEPILISFIKEQLNGQYKTSCLNKSELVAAALLQSKGMMMAKLIDECKLSQILSKNLLLCLNEAILSKIYSQTAWNMNLTHSTLMALKVLQYAQGADQEVIQESLRHLLIVDYLQEGEVLRIIRGNQNILNQLLQIRPGGSWFVLVAKLRALPQKQHNRKILSLQERGVKQIQTRIDKFGDLSDQLIKIEQSSMTKLQKLKMIQLLRGYSIFMAEYVQRQIGEGILQSQNMKIIQQLLGLKDVVSFQYLIMTYSTILEVRKDQTEVVSEQMANYLMKSCLGMKRQNQLKVQLRDSKIVAFLSKRVQKNFQFEVDSRASQTMKICLDRLLQAKGHLLNPKLSQSFQEYIHLTIQNQYDQCFNEHQFSCAINLLSSQVLRIYQLKPSQSQLATLKDYLISKLKWLLNLNESCMPEHRRCINFKIFDIITTFPFLFKNNDFLLQVVEDLLVNRMPDTFHYLHYIVNLFSSQDLALDSDKRDRLAEKLVSKGSNQLLSLDNKIKLWILLFKLYQKNIARIKELMELYSLYEDHWLAKYCAFRHLNIKGMVQFEEKIRGIELKMKSDHYYFDIELDVMRKWTKSQ